MVYAGSIAAMPDDHASRRERFAEIDALQPGWSVELRSRGSTVDASFVSPAGVAHSSVVPGDCGKLWWCLIALKPTHLTDLPGMQENECPAMQSPGVQRLQPARLQCRTVNGMELLEAMPQ